ncbi:hypothetical protein GW943_01300 [Candidatus Parcubacteria bacterium]|uniref:DUF3467 domain-containing protein n=1 Tax=Candidatus Kaiserbacteria bacterium CG10_big_fil_rev_8_21_14_0_10_47_16 TaxID=1974608 RepID=A0A2H0UDJ5_9BACT|nr:hypothetical protein [Candidatus Parcubacteria bacterium]PIR84461.1 MAG: hypothetical protein COU16_02680 [Candidatus Kaiserbacteria bacterium CG10_big_fil_rev_8_21_14_0_10_47_16]
MKPEDLQKAPKMFCENVMTAFTPEYFVMGLSSGNQANIYSFSPAHMKRLVQKLTHDLAEFEQKHGEITATWDPNIISPVQQINPPSKDS